MDNVKNDAYYVKRLKQDLEFVVTHMKNVDIEELNANLEDILHDCEKKALVSLDGQVDFKLTNKIKNGKLYVDQGIIAGCAGGGFENICAAADIRRSRRIPDVRPTAWFATGRKLVRCCGSSNRPLRFGCRTECSDWV